MRGHRRCAACADVDAAALILAHGLAPHPEGGFYRQTWAGAPDATGRPTGTAILYLLAGRSHWHRIDATEIWHFHAGAPLVLSVAATADGPAQDATLAPEAPQGIVPPGHWQAAATTGAFSLVGCTVTPGFRFEGFELAPPGFDIPRSP